MAVNKSSVDARDNDLIQKRIERYSKSIDNLLTSGHRRIAITTIAPRVVEGLIRDYRQAGWTVEPKIGFFDEYLEFS